MEITENLIHTIQKHQKLYEEKNKLVTKINEIKDNDLLKSEI